MLNQLFEVLGKKTKHALLVLCMLPLSSFAAVDWLSQISDVGYDPVPAGGNIVYVVKVVNNGDSPAPSTTVDIAVPANTSYTSSTGPMTCPPGPVAGPATITCTVPALAAAGNAGDTVNQNVTIKTTVQGNVTLTATVPTVGDADPANNVANQLTTVNAGADIALALTGPVTAQSGSTVTYVYTATNNGPDPASNVTLTIPAPTGLANIVTPPGCSVSGSNYACTIAGPIAVGAAATVNFTGQIIAAAGSTITPSGSTSGGAPADPIASNNTATFNTTVTAGSDLRIGKSRSPSVNPMVTGTAFNFVLAPTYTGSVPNTLTVTDTLPSNYTIGAITSPQNGWTCSVSGQTVTCTKPAGTTAGSNVFLGNISIPVTATTAGNGVVNTATIAGPAGLDPNTGNNSGSDPAVTIVDPTVDLRANKSGPSNPALVVVGNNYAYNISTSNVGTAPFFGTATMTDNLPAGLTVNSYGLNGWTCSPAAPVVGPNTITCTRPYTAGAPLAVNGTTPVVTLNTTATATGSIANSMTVSSPDANIADTNPGNDTTTYTVTGVAGASSADIRVVKTAAPATVVVGDVLTYTLEIVNAGPDTSLNVVVDDALASLINSNAGPTGSGFIGATITAGNATGGACTDTASGATQRNLNCTFTANPVCTAGVDCPKILIQVRPGGNATTSRTNTANALSQTTADPNLNNNTGSVTTATTAKADVTVTKSATLASVAAGQNLTYTIAAINRPVGLTLSAADNVTITDTLPSDVVFVSASPSTGSCTTMPAAGSTTSAANNQLVCNLGTVNNNAQQTVTVVVRPRTETRNTTLINNVAVATSTPETDGTNNTASVSTPVTSPVFDMLINKTVSVDPLAAGDNTVYTVTVTNQGPSATQGVVMTDTLPGAKLSYQSNTVSTNPGASCPTVPAVDATAGTIICNVPYLASGATASFTVTMKGVSKGVDTNSAHLNGSADIAFDTNSGNNATSLTTTVRTKADMQVVSKVPSATPVNLKQPFTFLMKVRNNTGAGLAEADNVVVTDNLPAGMQLTGTPTVALVAGTTTSSTCTGVAGGTSFTCNLGTVSSGGEVDITVPVRVVTVGGTFTNTASVATSSLDTNGGASATGGNNFNSGAVTVNKSSLAGTVYRDLNDDGVQAGAGETGIAGVQMRLTGTDAYGNPVNVIATTDGNGNYLFDNLAPSDGAGYTVQETQPAGFTDGKETAGSVGGDTTINDRISAIVLPGNTAATAYNFGELAPVTVRGNVFNDANGLLGDALVNSTGATPIPSTLTAYLVRGGIIVATSPVAADGTFSFPVTPNTTGYTVVLSDNPGAVGAPPPAAHLPTGWVNTGENNAAPSVAGNDGTVNGVSASFDVGLVDVPNRNFGIEQSPTSGVATYANQPNPGGTVTVPVASGAFLGALPANVTGSNANDATAVTAIRITAFPASADSVTINGTTYTAANFPPAGVTVTPAQLAGMVVDPSGPAVVTVDIPYVAIDAAGKESSVGHVILPFGSGGKIDVVKAVGIPKQTGAKVFEVPYSVVVGNVGATSPTVYNVQANDNLKQTFPTATSITVSAYAVAAGTGTPAGACTVASPTYAGTAAASSMLSGTGDLAGGQSCVITFRATVDFGTNPIPAGIAQNNTVYASGVGSDTVANPGYSVPDAGVATAPSVATTTDVSVDNVGVRPPAASAPGTPPGTPGLPATSGGDAPGGVPTPVLLTVQKIDVVKAVGIPKQTGAKVFEVPYSVVVGNVGATSPTVYNVQANDNLKQTFPTATSITVSAYAVAAGTGTPAGACTVASPTYAGTAAASSMLSGTGDLAGGQSCVITFRATVDFGTNPIPAGIAQNNTVYASGVGSDTVANPGYSVPDAGVATAPSVATTTDVSVDNVGVRPPAASAPGTPPGTPGLPATSGGDAPGGVPTPVLLTVQKIDVVKAAGVPKQIGPKVFEVPYSIVVGNVCKSSPLTCATTPTVYNVQADDNLKLAFPTATSIVVSNYVVAPGAGSPTCTAASPVFAGTVAASKMLSGTNDLTGGQSCVITFKVTLDFGANPVPTVSQNNTVYASGMAADAIVNPGYTVLDNGTATPPVNASTTDVSATAPQTSGAPGTLPPVPALPTVAGGDQDIGVPTPVILTLAEDGELLISKSTITKVASAGDVVEYIITVRNTSSNAVKTKVTDTPPLGFEYISGTGKVNGVPASSISNGNELIFDIGTVPSNSSTQLSYQMRLGDGVEAGDATNCVVATGINTLTNNNKESGKTCANVVIKTGLFLEKRANVTNAELGDSVEYSLRVKSVGGTTNNVTITDNLPLGFKLIAGTVRMIRSGVTSGVVDPTGAPGPVLTYAVGKVGNKEVVEIRYRLRLGIGADLGDGINRAQAKAPFATSSLIASVKVLVTRGVFTRDACVVGKVFVDCNQNKVQDACEDGKDGKCTTGEPGIPGVRLYMEDGTNITTDENGQYSLCGLRAINHVMQVDLTTMPVGSRMGLTSNRNLGDGVSLLMNPKAGELYRADFIESSCYPKILEQVEQRKKNASGVVSVPLKQVGQDKPGIVFDSKEQELLHPSLRALDGGVK